jgi:hypothetical protein
MKMTDDERRVIANTESFTFTGQDVSEWPRWLVFKNYATNADLTFIIIHEWDYVVKVYRGDTLLKNPAGDIRIQRNQILRHEFRTPTLVQAAA